MRAKLAIGLAVLALAVMAIIPLPPPFGNATSGCADWYIMKYLESHGWRPGMPPPILPMICWGPPLPPGSGTPIVLPPPPGPPHPIPLG
jgi:hypothetical protein